MGFAPDPLGSLPLAPTGGSSPDPMLRPQNLIIGLCSALPSVPRSSTRVDAPSNMAAANRWLLSLAAEMEHERP